MKVSFKLYDKKGSGIVREREFIDMVMKCYMAGHTLLKIQLRTIPGDGVQNLDDKMRYLQNSQKNKFKNLMTQEFNKYRFNMEVVMTSTGTYRVSRRGSSRARSTGLR